MEKTEVEQNGFAGLQTVSRSVEHSQFGVRPSYSFLTGRENPQFYYGGANTRNVNTTTSQGVYSRYGARIQQDRRPQRLSINPATLLDTQFSSNQQKPLSRRHSYATSPMRSPPVPVSTSKQPTIVWHSGDPVLVATPESRKSSLHSPVVDLEDSCNFNRNTAVALFISPPTLKHYLERLQDCERGVPMQERRVNDTLKKVFTGSDAIEWFLTNMDGITTVEKAQLTGQQLLKCGLIKSLNSDDKLLIFKGSPNSLYTFSHLSDLKLAERDPDTNNLQLMHGEPEKFPTKKRCILL